MSKEKKKHSRVGNVAASKKIKKKKAFVTKYIVPNSDHLTKVDRIVEPTNNSTINVKYIVPEFNKTESYKEETIAKTTAPISEVDSHITVDTVTQASRSDTIDDQHVNVASSKQEDSDKTKQEAITETLETNLNECITLSVTAATDESKPVVEEPITSPVIEDKAEEVSDVSINNTKVEELPAKPKTYRDMMLKELMTASPGFNKPSNTTQESPVIVNQTTVAEPVVAEPVVTMKDTVGNHVNETKDISVEDKPIDVASLFTAGVTKTKTPETSKEVKVGLLTKLIKWFKKLFGLTK